MDITFSPIGLIHSPFTQPADTPLQTSRSQAIGQVEVYPQFVDGLQDIEGLSHLILLYVFHQSSGFDLLVKPFLDDREHGVFATRYPFRPNPLGLSIVRLVGRRENLLDVDGIDVLDGTPLIDIKPYVPEFDLKKDVKVGWYATRSTK